MSETTSSGVSSPAPDLTPEEAQTLARRLFGIEARVSPLPSERDQNFSLDTNPDGGAGGYVLKIANPAEDPAVIDLQCAALAHFAETGSDLPLPRVQPTKGGRSVHRHALRDGRVAAVWLVDRLPGTMLEDAPSAVRDRELGRVAARLDQALQGFFHPAGRRELVWDLCQAQRLVPMTHALAGAPRQGVLAVLDAHARAHGALRRLPAQFIHNDLNPANLLHQDGRISGIVDFGDMVHAPRVNELAIAAAYRLLEADDPTGSACELAEGWHELISWHEHELAFLPLLIATRMATTVTVSHWRAARHPDNRAYILCHTERAEAGLARLADEATRRELVRRLQRSCGLGPRTPSASGTLLARRQRSLGRGLRLFYDQPLELAAGSGVTLRTTDGESYLDCYNNVAHVGHGHPAVVTAIARQAARLNTNTRYLTEPVVRYAERLADTFPEPLERVRFTCTGSEATDLALRIAGANGRDRGVVVTAHAYHGNTALGMAVSPEEAGLDALPPWVATVPVPADEAQALADLEAALERLEAAGHPVGALLFDTLFTSDGIFVPPAATIRALVGRVRTAGGIWIADEVQAGFGRTGESFWAFERYGVVPDLVTLGKPMGNGFPMAAIVMTEAMAARADALYYFNTFGGNPVAAAAGLAVLDVLADRGLQARAQEVGAFLAEGFERLDRHIVGDQRGLGLHRGLEIVAPGSGEPHGARAGRILERLRELGVLAGRTGPGANILKIRPPLVFEERHGQQLLDALDQAIG